MNLMFRYEDNMVLNIILSLYNVLIHILIGMIVGIALLFAATKNFNVSSVPEDIILLHIVLCVIGYTLIMPQSLLSMTSYNTWSSGFDKVKRRRAHWLLQVLGSGLALSGSIIIMVYKDINFNTIHGKIGLVAFIFTILSICSGFVSLFSYKLRRLIPPITFKITHIVLGIIAFASASACLCHGFNKNMFKIWTSTNVVIGLISITGTFTFIILINPLVTLYKKIIHLTKGR